MIGNYKGDSTPLVTMNTTNAAVLNAAARGDSFLTIQKHETAIENKRQDKPMQ